MLFNREHFILLLEGRSVKISPQDILKTISENCTEWLSNTKFELYRGISKHEDDYLIVDPSNHYRESVTGYDIYNAIIDNDWKYFPKRSKSIICTQDKSDTLIFGNPYLVIPFDNATFGVCSNNDIWKSFKNINNAQSLCEVLCKNISLVMREIDDTISVNDQMNKMSDYNELIKVSDFIDEHYKDFIAHFILINNKVKKNDVKKILDKITKLLDTKKLINILHEDIFIGDGFRVSSYKKLDLDKSESNEVWTESKCLFINIKEFEEKDSEFRKLLLSKYGNK